MIILVSDELLMYSSDNLKVVDNQKSLLQLVNIVMSRMQYPKINGFTEWEI